MKFSDAFEECPLTAILRGIRPPEVLAVSDALFRAGIRIVEVPMNSPSPLESIALLAKNFSGRLVCGAGTVLKAEWVDDVAAMGGEIIVAPNVNADVIRHSCELGLVPMPGFSTPTEAFTAYGSGARHLKLFPAVVYGTVFVEQLLAVLPPDAVIIPVGGIAAGDLAAWWKAGARGFGIGSQVYRPGRTPEDTYAGAKELVATLKQIRT
jgi:2-dehydro-3-deoxyphosphogalactonate aldolase